MTDTQAPAPSLEVLLAERHSCRAFLPEPVPRALVEQMLGLAQRAPSWCNTQPWHVHVTEGAATDRFRDGLRAACLDGEQRPDIAFPERYEGEAQARRRACAWQLYDSLGIAHGDRAASAEQMLKNFDLFDAPHHMVVTTETALGTYGAVDCGLYVAHVLLAAQSLGIATIAQAAIAIGSPFVHEHFGIGPERQVLCGISFGWADPDHPANAFRTERAGLDEAVTFLS